MELQTSTVQGGERSSGVSRLTVAALTAEPLLKACCSVHARLAACTQDLVGVGFGAGEEERGVIGNVAVAGSRWAAQQQVLTRWGCRPV